MPKYDVKCKDCENVWEVTHSVREDPVYVCPTCGSQNCRRMVGATRTLFKGTGFAINDIALDRLGMPKHVREINKDRLMRD